MADSAPPRRKDPLLAAICHDLRAPLASVSMGASFVLQTTADDPARERERRVLHAMLRSCKQMERVVRDFGDLSTIEAEAVELRPGAHDVASLLDLAAEAAREAAEARGVVLRIEPPTDAVTLSCDRERLLRALGHLVDNAIRIAPVTSEVTLAATADGTHVRFHVVDRGPGIADDTLAHLYDRAFHAKRADRPGAGLGLAIARGFAVAHGGSLDVTTAPAGTTFVLAVPRAVSSPA